MTKRMTKWEEIKEGYGLEEVPSELRKEFICCLCGFDYPRDKLYTDRPVGRYQTVNEYRQHVEKMRGNCYCRMHAERFFATQKEDE